MSDDADLVLVPTEVSDHPTTIGPPAPPRSDLFVRADWFAFLVTTIVVLGVYLLTIIPDVTLGYTGLFAVGTKYQGVPDPPGFPVFTLYSWPFVVLLPWSNIAWRVGCRVCSRRSAGLRSARAAGLARRRHAPRKHIRSQPP